MLKKTIVIVLLLVLSLGAAAYAQSTRPVDLSWTASTSPGVLGYNVMRATSAAGPFTTLNTSLVTTTSYVDSTAVIGSTYTYEVTAVAAACTATTPVGTPCGSSAPSAAATTTVPAQPAVTITVTVAVP